MKYPAENSTRKYRYGLYECPYCMNEFEARTTYIKSEILGGCQRGKIT